AFAARVAEEGDHRAGAVVAQAAAGLTGAVEAGDVAQALDRARAQRGLPGVGAGRRPVGDESQQVVVGRAGAIDVVAVARIHRETEVVADQRADPPALPLHHQALAPAGLALVLARVAGQGALFVTLEPAVGHDSAPGA